LRFFILVPARQLCPAELLRPGAKVTIGDGEVEDGRGLGFSIGIFGLAEPPADSARLRSGLRQNPPETYDIFRCRRCHASSSILVESNSAAEYRQIFQHV